MRNLIRLILLLASMYQTALGEQDGDWTYTVSNNQATITGYTGPGGEVTLPSSVNGVPVVQAGAGVNTPIFGWNNQTVTSLTIANGVTSIGNYAFNTCNRLISISLPASLVSIGDNAFGYCSSLSNISIPNGVTSIGYNAFEGCSMLTSIIIPNSVISIGDSAFYYCSRLTSVTIPNKLANVSDWTFYGCSSLPASDDFQYIIWGDEICLTKYLGSSQIVTVPGLINGLPVTKLLGNVFVDCGANLISVTLPDGLTRIGSGSFQNCIGLTSFSIPASVTIIGDYVFSGCTSLTSVAIPNGVTRIGYSLFSNCSGLTGINLPGSVTRIESGAFQNCRNITSLTIPYGVTSIGDYSFMNCEKLNTIMIPETIQAIGQLAFANCYALTNVTIPSSVTSIGNNAFGEEMSQMGVVPTPHNFDRVDIPERFLTDFARIGFKGPAAATALIKGIAENLAQNDAFITALANKIIARSGNYGLSIKSELETLATKSELASSLSQSRTDGINSVISNPNLWTLYTSNQIQNMAMGDLVLTKEINGQFILNYDIEQSTDLQNWTTYAPLSLPLTGLPTDKAFVRMKMKSTQSSSGPVTQPQNPGFATPF